MKKALKVISKLGIAAVLAAAAFPGAALAKEESGEIVIRLVKEWDDAFNADGKRPDKVWLRVKFDAVDTNMVNPSITCACMGATTSLLRGRTGCSAPMMTGRSCSQPKTIGRWSL
ncbi:hypothetical protein [Collinsella intestinalis]|uniref:hypothetical protein n=1 Tax=Collinsella intestinalis TaxID=147207 RepID=UPI0025A4BD96|nr:hypothetical protein [Collinsella intestinalis]MDM8162462.1 hypothetical protein [Collinsella intestinalis]